MQTIDVAHLLLPYVPIDRQLAAERGETLPDTTEGAGLFADLSGFTKLTQALANAYGPYRGAEELTRYLARTYEALIGAVHAYRGTVIGFSGDAITCWFDGDDGHAAVQAGFGMQEALSAVPPAHAGKAGEIAIAVKVAVVRGSARRFVVGDPTIQRVDVAAGAAIDRLAGCEKLTRPGEVVVEEPLDAVLGLKCLERRADAETGTRIAVVCPPETREPPQPWSEVGAIDPAWLESWVLAPVRDRLLAGSNLLAADFRPSAALFLSFRGIDYDGDPDAGPKLDAFIRWVQGVVAGLEGALIQLTFGDKGSYLYCTFGAPVAHDDDAARAVAAAQILRAPPQAYVRDVKIGVTYGQMYAGAYGSPFRCTYGVLGPKTNLAARLMSAASPGEVLCDRDVVQHARRHWRFTPLRPVRVKGVEQEVEIFAPEARTAAEEASAAQLVGRASELAQLREAVDALQAGQPQILSLTGPAGIGKTRLLRAGARMARESGVQVVASGEHAWGREAAFRPWRPIVWRLLGLDDVLPEARAERLPERVEELAPELAGWTPLLGDVFGIELPATDLTRDLAPESRTRNRTILLTELMRRRVSEGPWLFVFDEAQHLDSVSWDLVVAIARAARDGGSPLGLALAYRPQEIDGRAAAALGELQTLASRPPLELRELGGEDLAEIIRERFGLPPDGLPRALEDLLETRAAGNPFFAEELVQMLLEDGSLRPRAKGGWDLVAGGPGGETPVGSAVPGSLHGLVLARIDRAPASAARTLKVASVVGRAFGSDALRAAIEGDGNPTSATLADGLYSHLDALTSRDLIAATGSGSFRFPQITVHQVAYESLLFAQRRALHAVLADWHEDRPELAESERAPLLAYHHARAADGSGDDARIDRAAHWLATLADQHERVSAFAEAAVSLRSAIDLLSQRTEPVEQMERLRVRLGDMHERLGEYDVAESYLNHALEHAPTSGVRGSALAMLCLIMTRRGRFEDARQMGERALEAAPEDASLTALVRGRMGILAAMSGQLDEAAKLFEAAYEYYRESAKLRQAAAWLNNIGLGLIFRERYADAEVRLAEALDLSRAQRMAEIEAQVLTNLGLSAHKQGRLDEAAEHYRASLHLSRKLLAREAAVINTVNLGDIALEQGRSDEAWDAFLEAAREAADLDAMPRVLDALRGAAGVLVARERFTEAAEIVGFIQAHPAYNAEVARELDGFAQRVREKLGEATTDLAQAAGSNIGFEELLERLRRAVQQ